MSTNAPAPGLLGSKEGLKNPSLVNIEDVGLVLGKGIGALNLRSGYGTKNLPTFFEYSPVTMDEVVSELGKYKVEPKVFQGAHNAAAYIRGNSMFATDTYVLELPGDIVIVYQLTLIREIYNALIERIGTSNELKRIIALTDSPWGEQYNNRGVRKSEWMGVDDNGRRRESPYIDTSSMNSRDELKIIHELPVRSRKPEIFTTLPDSKKEFINYIIPIDK